MINRDDIEAGDKCFTRDGGCLVAREGVYLADTPIEDNWLPDGRYLAHYNDHPLDIIRIEKAPKPVVQEILLCAYGSDWHVAKNPDCWEHAIKLTIINGKLEKSEQVK